MTNSNACSRIGISMKLYAQDSKIFKHVFSRFSERRDSAYFFFWVIVALCLLFFTIGISVLKGLVYTNFLFFLLPTASFLSVRFKAIGLIICYILFGGAFIFFLKTIPDSDRLLYIGHFFTIALDLLIILLIGDELRGAFKNWSLDRDAINSQLIQNNLHFSQQEAKWEELQKELEEEILRLKEEVKQRKIDREQELKRCELLELEAKLWIDQKEKSLEELKLATKNVRESQKLEKEFHTLKEKEMHLIQELEKLSSQQISNEELLYLQERVLLLQSRGQIECDSANHDNAIARLVGQNNQLRSQFLEKSQILNSTRKELFQLETKFLVLEREKEENDLHLPYLYHKEVGDEKLMEGIEELEEEVMGLEFLIQVLLS